MTIAVIAEKPSVARDIARVLGARKKGKGYLAGGGWAVTWALGHLVHLPEPHQIRPAWRKWRRESLPMLPEEWPLVVSDKTREQFEIIRRMLTSPKVTEVVCATDAGREGELIFRYIYEAAGSDKPVRRLWISSLTEDAIRRGFDRLREGRDFDPLADAAKGRSRADWLVGMNLSRACSLAHDETFSVGRVQTPTLAMVVEREQEIRDFVPERYLEVEATFGPSRESEDEGAPTPEELYKGTWYAGEKPTKEGSRLPPDSEEAHLVVERVKGGQAKIESVRSRSRRMPAPFLYDLTELQRHANRLYGFSAKKTLSVAQGLYEGKKLLSYPRTDSRRLSTDVAATLPEVVAAIRGPYEEKLAPGTGTKPLGKRFVDDAQVTDHHAIIPTVTSAEGVSLSADERKIYDLVCRRLLAAWHGDHVTSITTVITAVRSGEKGKETVDRFVSKGEMVVEEGWKALDIPTKKKGKGKGKKDGESQQLPPGLEDGLARSVEEAKALLKKTRPPKRFTEATLLTAMETAGKALDDKELSAAMQERGLGTPATRAEIIETLLRREYLERQRKILHPTEKGERLISLVPPKVKSPAMTGEWEHELLQIQRGAGELQAFMEGIETYVREVVGETLGAAPAQAPAQASAQASAQAPGRALEPDPESGERPRVSSSSSSGSGEPLSGSTGTSGSAGSADGDRDGSREPPPEAWEEEPPWLRPDDAPPPIPPEAYGIEGSWEPVAEPTPRPSADPSRSPRAGSGNGSSSPREPEGRGTSKRGIRGEAATRNTSKGGALSRARSDSVTHGSPSRQKSLLGSGSSQARRGTEPGSSGISSAGRGPSPAAEAREPASRREPTPPDQLEDLLHEVFGFPSFRPYQEAVCRAVTEGADVLLVMPTGAGKSLCYQLPGIARGGTTLVISPLIALMEDQVGKLQAQGLVAERIHSGRSRLDSRRVCARYLDGELDFLFIAPERLAVPGFPEMLAKRKPVLVAVDEAHCISQWGHDFRPDYRLLGERLPLLRPAPVMGLTATATTRVQRDIVRQLDLPEPELFIHGFRRTNIAVEVAEMPPSARREAAKKVLVEDERRPAIVYVPSRREAEALAEELGALVPTAAYHAGMSANLRDRVQAAFLSGEVEVIVATIAFGMGIDKADVRTVVHTGLPGSLEGYYQEIGRAGRDGQPSRALLLYSWADRRTHEFFHERDYPEPPVLDSIYRQLGEGKEPKDAVLYRTKLDEEVFMKALEKLWIHGGVLIDPEENVSRGNDGWKKPYLAQRQHRLDQLADMVRFAETQSCRMVHLVEHFGDQEDSGEDCGICDLCAPKACQVRRFRDPTPGEAAAVAATLQALQGRDGQTTGQLFKGLAGMAADLDRKAFQRVLSAMAQAGLLELVEDSFEKDRRLIRFQRANLTVEGVKATLGSLPPIQVTAEPPKGRSKGRKKGSKGQTTSTRRKAAKPPTVKDADIPEDLFEALRAWRLGEARKRRRPAFHVLSDRVLKAIAVHRPTSEDELLAIHGIGPTKARKFGEGILAVLRDG